MNTYQAVTLSLLVHILFFLLGRITPIVQLKPKSEPIQWIDVSEENRPLLSDKKQRVDKETRTKATSSSPMHSLGSPQQENAATEFLRGGSKNQQKQDALKGAATKISDLRSQITPDSLLIEQAQRSSSTSSSRDEGTFLSTNSLPNRQQLQSFLPKDLQIGDMVALNTDQNLYFTFYRRMAEKVVWPWVQNVTAGFEKLKREGQLPGGDKTWTTVVEIILDKNGKVLSTTPLQLSGLWEIDSAPSKAFRQAGNFPNPPTEMIDEDGYIRIRYKFVVYYSPQSLGP